MAMIAAKCTQCGANIQVDDTKEAGICESCGTAFVTEKAINNYNTYVTNNNNFFGANINVVGVDADNLLNLANLSVEANNFEEALDYTNRVLEADSKCVDAWMLKMKVVFFSSPIGDINLNEIVSCGKNAIKFATEDKKEEIKFKVYESYLDYANLLMLSAITNIKDTDIVKRTFSSAGVNLVAISATQKTDAEVRSSIEDITITSIKFKNAVPEEYIENNILFQDKAKALANQYIEFCKADQERTKIYGLTPEDLNPNATINRRNNLSFINKGLKDKGVCEDEINHAKTGGCYIATCVYGSYDCPQVWTLRRFRDYTLGETWYGRLFIKCYYAISPTLVKWFGYQKWFRTFFRTYLDILIQDLNKRGVKDTKYQDKY